MNRALVVYRETEWRDLLCFYLEGHFDLSVSGVASVDEAILLLVKRDDKFQTVICGPYLDSERLLWSILAEGHEPELILNSDPELKQRFPFRGRNWVHFVPGLDWVSALELMISADQQFCELEPESKAPIRQTSTKLKIKPRLLLESSPLVGPLWIRKAETVDPSEDATQLGTTDVLWLEKGSEVSLSEIDQMVQDPLLKGFYVEKERCADFSGRIQDNLVRRQKEIQLAFSEGDYSLEKFKEKHIEYLKKRLDYLKRENQSLKLSPAQDPKK